MKNTIRDTKQDREEQEKNISASKGKDKIRVWWEINEYKRGTPNICVKGKRMSMLC